MKPFTNTWLCVGYNSDHKVLEKDATKGIWYKNNAHGILPALCTSKEPDYGTAGSKLYKLFCEAG